MPKILLDSVSADTTGAPVLNDGSAKMLLVLGDNFGNGSVTIDVSDLTPDASSPGNYLWAPVTKDGEIVEFTANAVEVIDYVAAGVSLRAKFLSSTGASNVSVKIF